MYDWNQNLKSEHHLPAAQCALEQPDPAQIKSAWYTYESRFNHLKTKIDAAGNHHRLRKEIRPRGQETTYTYNTAGKPSTKLDAKGPTTTYTYNDTTNQLTQISYADGRTVNFTYDRVGNLATYSDCRDAL